MNEQESEWGGEFGDQYQRRNAGAAVGSVKSNIRLFKRIFRTIIDDRLDGIRTVIEFGAGAGNNLLAINGLVTAELTAVEINTDACGVLHSRADIVINSSILDYHTGKKHDLVLSKGLLIHIPPVHLSDAYAKLYHASRRYILLCEYYCPTPRMIPYHGKDNMLWARDFAGEMMQAYPLKLIDYGFVSKYDEYPQDDLHWFLMEKI